MGLFRIALLLVVAALPQAACASLFEYGNYCGMDRADPTGRKAPVDDIDCACKIHDECYGTDHDAVLACDRAFVCRLIRSRNTTTGFVPTLYRELAITYFSIPLAIRNITGYHDAPWKTAHSRAADMPTSKR